jgi:hypothetical protein
MDAINYFIHRTKDTLKTLRKDHTFGALKLKSKPSLSETTSISSHVLIEKLNKEDGKNSHLNL